MNFQGEKLTSERKRSRREEQIIAFWRNREQIDTAGEVAKEVLKERGFDAFCCEMIIGRSHLNPEIGEFPVKEAGGEEELIFFPLGEEVKVFFYLAEALKKGLEHSVIVTKNQTDKVEYVP